MAFTFDSDAPDAFAKAAASVDAKRSSRPLPEELDLKSWPLAELLAMHAAIEAVLPVKDLKDMDLSRELVLQVQSLRQLQDLVQQEESNVPANQRAQVANSLSSALVNLVKLQASVFNSERFKRAERFLIEFLNELPSNEERELAIGRYEAIVAGEYGES
jgi:hypothetical protein